MNPWIGVSLIALGIAGTVLFAHFHIYGATALAGIIPLGVSIIMARRQIQVQKDFKELKNSIRPPSIVDENEINSGQ